MLVLYSRPVRFVLVGGVVTLIDLGLTYLVILTTGTRIISTSVGFFGGLVSSYLLHAKFSFSTVLAPRRQVPKYIALVALNYFLTIGLVLMATDIINLSTIAGKIFSLPIVAVVSYFVSKHWVY